MFIQSSISLSQIGLTFILSSAAQEAFWFKHSLIATQQAGNANAFSVAFFALAAVFVVIRFGVSGDDTFKVAQDHMAWTLRDEVFGHNWNLTAATGRVHHKGGNAVTGGMTTQAFDNLDAFAN